MTVAETPWLAAWVTVCVSFVLACILAWRLPRGATPYRMVQSDLCDDVEARYGQAIAQLRDLAQQKHRLTASAFSEEKQEYEALAQTALANLATAQQATSPDPVEANVPVDATPAVRFLAAQPQLKGALWGAGCMGLAMFLWFTVQRGAAPGSGPEPGSSFAGRNPMAATDSATGTGPMGAAAAATAGPGASADVDEMKALAEQLKTSPDDVPHLLRFAHLLLRAQMLEEASTINERALHLAPNDLEALTHAAVLAASRGDAAAADSGLEGVLKKDPTFVEAWFFRGMLALQQGDMPRVEASFTAFLQHAPPGAQRDRVASMLAGMGQNTP